MGRPVRHDVDYFPFYAKDGKTLFVLEGKYQCKGSGFFTNLLRFLSRTPDHHYSMKDEGDELFFFASVKCDNESGLDMIGMMVKTGKLDKDLWEQHRVLASEDFLESVKDAYRKRNIACITMEQIRDNFKITTGRNPQASEFPAEETPKIGLTGGINPQSKVKKRKVKKRIEFKPPTIQDVISYFLEKGYSTESAKKAFEYYNEAKWHDSKGSPVRNWKQKMIAVWFKDENKEKTDERTEFLRRHGAVE